jgi:hypothetical protein
MVQPLFFSGEFEDLFLCFDRILKSYEKQAKAGTEQRVVNAVIDTVVALAYWPPALLVTGQVELARARLAQVMQMAEDSAHPPTLCSVLNILCNEYYPHTGEVEECASFASQVRKV